MTVGDNFFGMQTIEILFHATEEPHSQEMLILEAFSQGQERLCHNVPSCSFPLYLNFFSLSFLCFFTPLCNSAVVILPWFLSKFSLPQCGPLHVSVTATISRCPCLRSTLCLWHFQNWMFCFQSLEPTHCCCTSEFPFQWHKSLCACVAHLIGHGSNDFGSFSHVSWHGSNWCCFQSWYDGSAFSTPIDETTCWRNLEFQKQRNHPISGQSLFCKKNYFVMIAWLQWMHIHTLWCECTCEIQNWNC